ncbi:PLD nuclease N-terminal domain-containing protein [Alkalicoccus urumqiensis]|uniref:Transcriptional regulator n=1 Tax=Alkalicoccus urumqiensis TaxID=1548213 RepID=A0A2P6MDE9_ALKUR|nr:PLD nuclease N-terminal domain-containing protein [Alkalicoccus urumqiensis]PRO64293.1 transcriptional regulator [Alkalicoccus urumqiensis]
MELLDTFNMQLLLPLLLLDFVLKLSALIACVRQEMTKEKRALWIIIIVFINFLGPILYFLIGRRNA